jgi:hypothetical protein
MKCLVSRWIKAVLLVEILHLGSKTTGIYTHVTEKSLQKIKSPFDDL